MTRTRVFAGIVTAAFCLTLSASVRADNAHADNVNVNIQLEKLIFAERHQLGVENEQGENEQGEDTNYLYTAHFENNNGKHLGFSMGLVHNGPKTGNSEVAAWNILRYPKSGAHSDGVTRHRTRGRRRISAQSQSSPQIKI